MGVVDVDDILKVFRVVPKIVEVEKIVEKVVDRIVEVPQVVPVEKVIEKIVEVEKIKEVELHFCSFSCTFFKQVDMSFPARPAHQVHA